jgi:hypothetical protein
MAPIRTIRRGELLRATIHVRFHRILLASIPTSRDARADWLRERWQEIDAWVATQQAR